MRHLISALPSPMLARARMAAAFASAAALMLVLSVWAPSSHAALAVGTAAPDFSTDAALGGKAFRFSLASALKKGPVVVYFYPKAFTSGCTVEAHQFAEATPKFEALGATVIGMSNDNIETLKQFSVEACRNKFAVGADAGSQIMKSYDAALMMGMADRISYVISPEGKVLMTHASMDPDGHVIAALKAVEQWRARQKS